MLAAGAWTSYFVPDLDLPLEVERIPVLWFEPLVPRRGRRPSGACPVWILETETDGSFYGFPYDPGVGLKVARHHSGVFVSAEDVDRALTAADEARVRAFARAHMPAADGPLTDSAICLYTNTPDGDFILDTHPAAAGVAFASACSGHGFKFAPVIGEALADLALTGRSTLPIEPLPGSVASSTAASASSGLPRRAATMHRPPIPGRRYIAFGRCRSGPAARRCSSSPPRSWLRRKNLGAADAPAGPTAAAPAVGIVSLEPVGLVSRAQADGMQDPRRWSDVRVAARSERLSAGDIGGRSAMLAGRCGASELLVAESSAARGRGLRRDDRRDVSGARCTVGADRLWRGA